MKFVDSCKVRIVAGNGGNGCVAFRRERYIPFGGPSGGDGGKGGDVVFVGDEGKTTLLDVAMTRTLQGARGEHGRGKDQYGKAGEDRRVLVPVGTQGYDVETNELLFDVDAGEKHVVVARGGRGGRGNIHFATPFDRAPRRADPGELGEDRTVRLELKVMADVGLLGFPNVGKSTFIRAVSRARPKVADYPFTTLIPHLGVVAVAPEKSFVLADIPGLIPGAASGAGLGIRFLKHVERTRVLLHIVSLDAGEGRDPLADYDAIQAELAAFDPELARRPQVVAMNKADLPDVREAWTAAKKRFKKRGIDLRLVSAATGEGVRELLFALYALSHGEKEAPPVAEPSPEGPGAKVPVTDRTEEASPRRLRKAREEGDSGASAYAAQAVAFLVAVAVVPSAVRALAARAANDLRGAIGQAGSLAGEGGAGARFDAMSLATAVLALCLPLLTAAGVAGAVAHAVQTGGVVASKRLSPNLERLNPFLGVRNLFSTTRLFAVGRALVAGMVVAWLAVRGLGDHLVDLARLGGRLRWVSPVVAEVAGALAWRAAVFGLALGVLDVVVTRGAWLRRLRMTKDEVRREHKDAEGDPQRKAARERAYHELLAQATLANVRTASVVVVNPTHLACALRYDEKEGDQAPVVVARGEGPLAQPILRAAEGWGIPVVRDVPLARALIALRVGDVIPEALYQAVAELLRDLRESTE